MVANHRAGKPLLEGASLYRGSRLPDQSLGTFGKELHTSLLPQVAASYTHNWKERDSYIGAYPVDRATTRFTADFGMEKSAGSTRSYSVAEVEKALEPMVAKLAAAKEPADRMRAEARIESMLKTSFYEAGVPARTGGEATRPKELFVYTGRPDIEQRRAVTMQMKPMTAEAEKPARYAMLTEHKSPSMQATEALLIHRNASTPALRVVLAAAQRDHSAQLMREHATKPLKELIGDIARQPASPVQEKLERFAQALHEGVNSSNTATSQKALAISSAVGKLDPKTVTFSELSAVSAGVSAQLARAEGPAPIKTLDAGSGKADFAATARAPSSIRGGASPMDR